jgi:hypothetical protein
VRLGVVLGSMLGVFQRVKLVSVRDVRMMTGGDMIAGFVVLRRFAMMMGCMVEMFCSLVVVVVRRMFFTHWVTPS